MTVAQTLGRSTMAMRALNLNETFPDRLLIQDGVIVGDRRTLFNSNHVADTPLRDLVGEAFGGAAVTRATGFSICFNDLFHVQAPADHPHEPQLRHCYLPLGHWSVDVRIRLAPGEQVHACITQSGNNIFESFVTADPDGWAVAGFSRICTQFDDPLALFISSIDGNRVLFGGKRGQHNCTAGGLVAYGRRSIGIKLSMAAQCPC